MLARRLLSVRAVAPRLTATRVKPPPEPAPARPSAGAGFGAAGEILQRYDHGRSSMEEVVLELFHGGISPAHAEIAAQRLFGPASGLAELSARAQALRDRLDAWRERPLARSGGSVFLHAVTVAQKPPHGARETTVAVAVGVDLHGVIAPLGIVAAPGAVAWDDLLGGLRCRGLAGVELFVGDREPEARAAVRRHFPRHRFQLCLHRLEEQVLYKVPAHLVPAVVDGFAALRAAGNRDQAQAAVTTMETRFHADGHPAAAALLETAGGDLFHFLAYPAAHRLRFSDASFVRKPLSNVRVRARLLGPGLDDDALALLTAARLRHAWPENSRRRFVAR